MDRARSIRGRLPRWAVGWCVAAGVLAPLVVSQSAVAADCTKYASTGGSDGAAGTAAAPYRTAQKLADSLSAGQVGCLTGGGVFGGVRVNRSGITLTSAPGQPRATLLGSTTVPDSSNDVVIENLIEITLLANKMGVPRHAFLSFMNNGVMGSMFTAYKTPALVNLDWTTTFTPELLRKDLDLGLELGREWDVPMPVTAATREVLQGHFGAAMLQKDPAAYLEKDFAALMETMALAAGMKLEPENVKVSTGLE